MTSQNRNDSGKDPSAVPGEGSSNSKTIHTSALTLPRISSLRALLDFSSCEGKLYQEEGKDSDSKRLPTLIHYAQHLLDSLNDTSKWTSMAFVCPFLPHPNLLEVWDDTCAKLGMTATVFTKPCQQVFMDHYHHLRNQLDLTSSLHPIYLHGIPEDPTFMGGLESSLLSFPAVVAWGESHLSTFQALKAVKRSKAKLVVWQCTPRPLCTLLEELSQPKFRIQSQRETSLREEILKGADALVSTEKDSAVWAFHENVAPSKLQRINRSVAKWCWEEQRKKQTREDLRGAFGFKPNDFVFFHLGGLEAQTGALETLFAFKTLLSSYPGSPVDRKLLFCGLGKANGAIRQHVMKLKLDDSVFFIQLDEQQKLPLGGNQLMHLLPVSDVVVCGSLGHSNSQRDWEFDVSHDVFSACAMEIPIISSGLGNAGAWISRFQTPFAAGNIHSQAKGMHLLTQQLLSGQNQSIKAAKKCLLNEMSGNDAVQSFTRVLKDLENSLTRSLTEDEAPASLWISKAQVSLKEKLFSQALTHLESAFSCPQLTLSQEAQLHQLTGECALKLGDFALAFQSYQTALEKDPQCHHSMVGLGTLSLQKQAFTIAVPQFQKAVEWNPQSDVASLGLALAFQGLKDFSQAHHWSLRACQLNPENTAALYCLVQMAYESEEFEPATDVLTRYTQVHPNDLNMWYSLAGIHFVAGNREKAAQIAGEIVQKDPLNTRAISLLQQIQKQQTQKMRA